MRKLTIISMLILCFVLAGFAQAADSLTIGVLAKRGAKKCLDKWSETGNYLSEQLGKEVTILPLKFTEIEPKVAAGEVDFVLANSSFYAVLAKQHGVKAVATLINSRQGEALNEFGGVILVKADSPIQTLDDIKGKKYMCVKFSSFGGCQMAAKLLADNGIDPATDCAAYIEGGKHDNVVLAVKSGMADVGTVRSDTMERMAAEGQIDMADFRIIHQVEDDFPFVRSTQLYPEWPMAACAGTTDEDAAAISAALKALTAEMPAAQAAKVVGWADAVDYDPVVGCLTTIKYGVFGE